MENFIRKSDPEMSSILHTLIRKGSRLSSILLSTLGRHRSKFPIDTKNLIHPRDVEILHGQLYGPGMYFAKTGKSSQELFSKDFGGNIYKITTSTKNIYEQFLGRQKYLNETNLLKEFEIFSKKYPDSSKGYKYDPLTAKVDLESKFDGSQIDWNDPFIQYLNNKGYIGYSHRGAFTNWRVGIPGSGYAIKKTKNEKYF